MKKPTIPLVRWAFKKLSISALEIMTRNQRQGDVERAGADCICEICGHKYIDHPQISEYPELHVVCDWSVYKL